MIIGIVCCDNNFGIGKGNKLLFHIKEDMQFFKETTLNHIVCMGKNTFLSLPNQLPLVNRQNVVLSSNSNFNNCINVHSLNELLAVIQKQTDDVYIIGGAQLYKAMLPYYDKILLTRVYADGDADTFFPNIDNKQFTKSKISDIINTDKYKIQFIEYRRMIDEG